MGVIFSLDCYGGSKMNIEEKTKMAHDMATAMQSSEPITDIKLLASLVWQYADAMEAEADKRIKERAEKDAEESKVFFEKLTKNEDGSCKHFHTTLNRVECFDCGENLSNKKVIY